MGDNWFGDIYVSKSPFIFVIRPLKWARTCSWLSFVPSSGARRGCCRARGGPRPLDGQGLCVSWWGGAGLTPSLEDKAFDLFILALVQHGLF